MKKTITVFGSAKPADGDGEFNFAYELGSTLAKNNFNVCTGGYRGIMNAVSKGVVENGGEATGITVKGWGSSPSEFLTKEIKTESLFERVSKLIELGDAYIILQGGTGTLLEFSAVWELINKKLINKKPVICFGTMWGEVVSLVDKQLEKEDRETGLIKLADDINEAVIYLKEKLI